ncbi:MAG TPA: DsbE family thiol:disulfide interchange protein [Acetobacteraceae bacterium]
MVNRRLLLMAPFGVAAVFGAGMYSVLGRMKRGTFDPHDVPSQLIGRPVPQFNLPGQGPGQGFGSAELQAQGRPVLLNFFASWCVPCVVEHPELMSLSGSGLPIWGIAYKDTVSAASGFLQTHGNPFTRVARDAGSVAIDFGVYGVPESYLLDRDGIIRWHVAGPLTEAVVAEGLRPALARLA